MKKDTMEYWVYAASKGMNVAECWQNCNRILEESLIVQKEKDIERVRLIVEKWLHKNKESCIHEFGGLSETINKLKGE